MGRREKHSLESNLVILRVHLLKWRYQPNLRSGNWNGSIVEHRRRIRRAIEDSPSLMAYFYVQDILPGISTDTVEQAIAETGLPSSVLPEQCPFTMHEIRNRRVLPD